jgi:hypothetical protein
MPKQKAKKRCRHRYGEMVCHSDPRDGDYQVCEKCGAVRFKGERRAYTGSDWK